MGTETGGIASLIAAVVVGIVDVATGRTVTA